MVTDIFLIYSIWGNFLDSEYQVEGEYFITKKGPHLFIAWCIMLQWSKIFIKWPQVVFLMIHYL